MMMMMMMKRRMETTTTSTTMEPADRPEWALEVEAKEFQLSVMRLDGLDDLRGVCVFQQAVTIITKLACNIIQINN